MSLENKTFVIDFLLVGFKDLNSLKLFLFFLFSIIYIFTLSGNLLIIVLVLSSSRLHSPMYFFITNLSLSEVIFTTNIIPNMLENLLMGDNKISVPGCLTQYYIFSSTATTECFLLAIMSYDRYLAICNPLRYASFMDPTVCNHLVIWAWLVGFFISMITLILLCELYYCGPNEIDNFFCDLTPLIELACSDTLVVEIESFLFASVITLLPFVFIIISYSLIIYTIMKIPSTTGRKKAFSTCSSHLAVVCTYYGTLIALYVSPSKRKTFNLSKVLSLLYTIVTPLLNPIIYSLRNKEIKKEITKIVRNLIFFSK